MADKKPIVLYSGEQKEIATGDTMPIANGGTGATSAQNARNALLPTQTGNSGKVLGTDGTNASWVTAGGGGGIELNTWGSMATTASISNTASETVIATVTIPANTLITLSDTVKFYCSGLLLNNTGSNRTFTLSLDVDGSRQISDATGNIATSANSRIVTIEGEITIFSGGYAFIKINLFVGSAAASPTNGIGDFGATALLVGSVFQQMAGFSNAGAIDIDIVMAMSFASTSLTWTPYQSVFKKLGSNNTFNGEATLATVSNTSSDSIFLSVTIPSNTFVNEGDTVTFFLTGILLNDSGSARTAIVSTNVAGIRVVSDTTASIAVSATTRLLRLDGTIVYYIVSGTHKARLTLNLFIGSAASAATGTGDFGATALLIGTATNEFNFTETSDNDIDFYVQFSAANANLYLSPYRAFFKKL